MQHIQVKHMYTFLSIPDKFNFLVCSLHHYFTYFKEIAQPEYMCSLKILLKTEDSHL